MVTRALPSFPLVERHRATNKNRSIGRLQILYGLREAWNVYFSSESQFQQWQGHKQAVWKLLAENLPSDDVVPVINGEFIDSDHQLGSQTSICCEVGCLNRAVNAFFVDDHQPPASSSMNLHGALDEDQPTNSLCDYLVCTLAESAVLEASHHTLLSLSHCTIMSWNCLIVGYTESRQAMEALNVYHFMREEGVVPNKQTYISLFKASGSIPDLLAAKRLHFDAQQNGFVADVFVSSTMIWTYGKCGCVLEAETVFNDLFGRNIVSWNSLLSAYVGQCQGVKALLLYRQMQEEGVGANHQTFSITLRACDVLVQERGDFFIDRILSKTVSLEVAKALHADAWRKGFASNPYIGSILVNIYGKYGSIVEAEAVFNWSTQRTVVSWNTMLSAYAQQGQSQLALRLYRQMQEEQESPNHQTFVIVIQACGILIENEQGINVTMDLMGLDIVMALHCGARRMGFMSNSFICNTLVSVYGKCGLIVDATNVFCGFRGSDNVSWNAVLSAYVQQGQGKKALQLYMEMLEEGFSSNQQSFVIALQACDVLAENEGAGDMVGFSMKLISLEIGKALHADAWRIGFASDAFVGSTLITMYGKYGSIIDAENVFDRSLKCDVVLWNAMLSAYIDHGLGEKALELYKKMVEERVMPSIITSIAVLQACCETGNLEACQQIHFKAASAGYDLDCILLGTLIHAYGNCASMKDALVLFDALTQPDMVLWTACITGHAQEGNVLQCAQLFEKMQQTGIVPNRVTFLSLLNGCSHAGLVNEGMEYFHTMYRKYGLFPDSHHYGILIDTLGRAGNFKMVENVLLGMPMQASLVDWWCLLSACRTHSYVEMVKYAFDLALGLQPEEAATYVLMSNAYIHFGLQMLVDEEG